MQELGVMKSIKETVKLFRNNPIITVTTLVGMGVGAFLGVLAFYNGWLG